MADKKELDPSNNAHASVFMFMRMNSQSTRALRSEGEVEGMGPQKLQELVYFNNAASQAALKANAAVMAHLLYVLVTTYYTQQREKKFANKSVPDVVTEITALMIQGEKTVFDLAGKLDDIFVYKNENSAAVPAAAIAKAVDR